MDVNNSLVMNFGYHDTRKNRKMFGKTRFITFEDDENIPFQKILVALEDIGCDIECGEVTDYVEALEEFFEEMADKTLGAISRLLDANDKKKKIMPESWDRFRKFFPEQDTEQKLTEEEWEYINGEVRIPPIK